MFKILSDREKLVVPSLPKETKQASGNLLKARMLFFPIAHTKTRAMDLGVLTVVDYTTT